MAATNRVDILDPAISPSGPFRPPQMVWWDRPDVTRPRGDPDRSMRKNKPLAEDVDLKADRPDHRRHHRSGAGEPAERGGHSGGQG